MVFFINTVMSILHADFVLSYCSHQDSPEKQNTCVHTHTHTHICYKLLTHMIMEVEKVYSRLSEARDPGDLMV